MADMAFDITWLDAAGVTAPELSATWANLTIRVGDSVVTRVLDERAQTVRDYVQVSVYPLAEWLASNWWFLTSESSNPIKQGDREFQRRHSLRPNREGYAYPDLNVTPSGAWTHLTWKRYSPEWTKVEFLDDGGFWVDRDRFREVCSNLISKVVRRLELLGVQETFLKEEWNAVQSADPDEAKFCAAAAGLGWDPYDIDDARSAVLLDLDKNFGGMLDEVIPALEPERLGETRQAIAKAQDWANRHRLAVEGLEILRPQFDRAIREAKRPWDAGYFLARHLRHRLNVGYEPVLKIDHLADVFGGDSREFERATTPVKALEPARLVDGVVASGGEQGPGFAFRKLGSHGKRFHLCRALCEAVASPSSDTLLTRAHSERQQRSRAFAAEFLAPAQALKERVTRPFLDADDVSELASEFGVSSNVIELQVKNHSIAQVWP